jgi:predicted nucleotidyltransferase
MNTDQEQKLKDIERILIAELQPNRIYLFGSRALEKNKEYSDYDIAVDGITASHRQIRKAKESLDDALGIHSCDLIEMEKVSPNFKQLIEEQGKILYESN